jgi:hypothetical protein
MTDAQARAPLPCRPRTCGPHRPPRRPPYPPGPCLRAHPHHLLATVLAVALVGASVALAVLLTVAVPRVVRPRSDGLRSPSWERRRRTPAWGEQPFQGPPRMELV